MGLKPQEILEKIRSWWRPDVISPEKVKQFIEMIPLFKKDKDDPAFKSQKEIREIQNKNLRRQIELCAKYSPYYKELFKKHNIDPSDIKTIDDLEKIPLTFKSDYMKDPEAFRLRLGLDRPFWELILWDVTFTTGTVTGRPSIFYNTTHDIYATAQFLMRSGKICWATPYDVVFNAFPFGPIPHIGYNRCVTAGLAEGCAVVAGHTGIRHPEFPIVHRSLDETIELCAIHRCTIIMGIASYLRRFVMRAEELGVDLSSVRIIHALGEPCPKGMREDLRKRLESLGAEDVFIHNGYGFTECQGSFSECTELGGNHNPDPTLYFIEIVDPETGERKEEGEEGAIAITHLNRRGTVLLRYVLGDIGKITYETCPYCGRNTERLMPIHGSVYATRTKDLIKVKGTLINPGLLNDTIENIKGIAEYQVVITKEDPKDPYSMDKVIIRVAPTGERDVEDLKAEILDKVFKAIEMRPEIVIEPSPYAIYDPRVSLKATRIVDKRPKVE
ncbi:MAG: phenylacetate--CoA ligase family protein [Candidatus Baldrarchaeia archaeon]